MNGEVAALLGGLGVNVVVLGTMAWKQGRWTGRVTTLLEQHQRDLYKHDERINGVEREVSTLRGALE